MHGAPRDYVEMYREYRGFVTQLVRSRRFRHLGGAYIPAQDVPDAVEEILLRVMEHDGLSHYNPDTGSFKAYLAGYAYLLLNGIADKLLLRYLWRFEFVGLSEDLQWYMDPVPDFADEVCGQSMVDTLFGRVRERLRTDGAQRACVRADLVAFFDLLVLQVREYGEVDLVALSQAAGCGSTAANTRLWKIREAVCTELGVPVPAKQSKGPGSGAPRPVAAAPDPWAPARSAAERLARLLAEYGN